MAEELLNKLLRNTYGDFKLHELTGGYTNKTYLLKGSQPLVAVKLSHPSNADILNEVNCLKYVDEKQIAPRLYDFIKTEDCLITVMDYHEGTNGQSILDARGTEAGSKLYKKIGERLALDVHSQKYQSASHGIKELDIQNVNLDLEFIPPALIESSKVILQGISTPKRNWVLTHGDYGIHNVLFKEEEIVTILDWEWAEWGSPLADISWVCWFTSLHYPAQSAFLNNIFLEEYQKHSSLKFTSEELKAHSLYKVWKVLSKVRKGPEAVKKEWVRRLQWTVESFHILK